MIYACTVEPLLRGHPDERPASLEKPLDTVNLNIDILISTPDERPPHLKGHFSGAKMLASQEGFHCIMKSKSKYFIEEDFPNNEKWTRCYPNEKWY